LTSSLVRFPDRQHQKRETTHKLASDKAVTGLRRAQFEKAKEVLMSIWLCFKPQNSKNTTGNPCTTMPTKSRFFTLRKLISLWKEDKM